MMNQKPERPGFEGKKLTLDRKTRYKSESVPDLNVSEDE